MKPQVIGGTHHGADFNALERVAQITYPDSIRVAPARPLPAQRQVIGHGMTTNEAPDYEWYFRRVDSLGNVFWLDAELCGTL